MILRSRWLPPALFLIVSLIIRAQTLGLPLLHMDENFYLLVGDRMAHAGALPYVDIWDRKPVGLFLLYAGFSATGGDAVVVYQLAALLCAAGTAWLVYAMAALVVDRRYALVAGIIYLAYLTFFGGYGGQSPVYYNLLMAGAGYTVLRMASDDRTAWQTRRPLYAGALAMLLVGCAIQIKYSVVFEGVFFGLVMLWSIRRTLPLRILMCAGVWALIALVPTALAWAAYVHAGHGDAFFYANFISVFDRQAEFTAQSAKRLASLAGLFAVMLLLVVPAFGVTTNPAGRIIKLWVCVAVVSLLLFGTFYNHYGLPLVLPMAVMSAFSLSVMGQRWPVMGRGGLIGIALFFLLAGAIGTYVKVARKGDQADIVHILGYWKGPQSGCPWFMGTTAAALYTQSGACLPTRYPMSGHLFETHERPAIGIDPLAEIDRILGTRPPVITMDEKPRPEEDMALRQRFVARLADGYRDADRVIIGNNAVRIYVRK